MFGCGCAEVHRYNHNLETARSFFTNVVTTHTWEERWETLSMVREVGMEVCRGGNLGTGETLEQRAEIRSDRGRVLPLPVQRPQIDLDHGRWRPARRPTRRSTADQPRCASC
jgi:radical SAM family protein